MPDCSLRASSAKFRYLSAIRHLLPFVDPVPIAGVRCMCDDTVSATPMIARVCDANLAVVARKAAVHKSHRLPLSGHREGATLGSCRRCTSPGDAGSVQDAHVSLCVDASSVRGPPPGGPDRWVITTLSFSTRCA